VAAALGLARADGGITLRLNAKLGGGDVAVKCAPDGVWWMEQMAPTFVDPLPVAQLAALVPNWESIVDEAALLEGAVVPEVSTGLPYLLIPVAGAEALAAVATPSGGVETLTAIGRSAETHPLTLHSSLYFYHLSAGAAGGGGRVRSQCRVRNRGAAYVSEYGTKWMSGSTKRQCDRALGGGGSAKFCSRMFCFEQGAWLEDAATGSAAGCLAAHLALHAPQHLPASIEQGVQMGRPSALRMDATAPAAEGDAWRIRVGGKVVPVASGTWDTPNM
jgi:predicted PhzF superfamily epimerase YddE/YHI9